MMFISITFNALYVPSHLIFSMMNCSREMCQCIIDDGIVLVRLVSSR